MHVKHSASITLPHVPPPQSVVETVSLAVPPYFFLVLRFAQSIWLSKCAAHAIFAASPQGLEGLGVRTGGRCDLLVVPASSVLRRML